MLLRIDYKLQSNGAFKISLCSQTDYKIKLGPLNRISNIMSKTIFGHWSIVGGVIYTGSLRQTGINRLR